MEFKVNILAYSRLLGNNIYSPFNKLTLVLVYSKFGIFLTWKETFLTSVSFLDKDKERPTGVGSSLTARG